MANDTQIRSSFHRKRLPKHHANPDTLVVDELGLRHGKYRADIAVINGHFIGYEIKSDQDSLGRLGRQLQAYSDVFDLVTIVAASKHVDTIKAQVPDWWGIIVSKCGNRGGIYFETIRSPQMNREVDLMALAQLLWKHEAAEILLELGVEQRILRQRREVLYKQLVASLTPTDLKYRVREYLKNRTNWRCPRPPFQDDGSSQLSAR